MPILRMIRFHKRITEREIKKARKKAENPEQRLHRRMVKDRKNEILLLKLHTEIRGIKIRDGTG